MPQPRYVSLISKSFFIQIVLRTYRYLFFKVLTGLRKSPFNWSGASLSAAACVAFAIVLNIGTIFRTVELFTGKNLLTRSLEQPCLLAIGLILYVISYFTLGRGEGLKSLEGEFASESDQKRKRGNLIVGIYVFGSFIAAVLIVFVRNAIWADTLMH